MNLLRFQCVTIIFLIATKILGADTIYVATNGTDLGTGKINAPYQTIAKGISTALAGDIIFLKKGLYRERVVFTKNGEQGKPIILTGEKDVIIDGGTLITGWEKVTDWGGNIYRLPYTGSKPYNLTWNNKYILRIRDEFLASPGMFTTLRYGPEGWDTYDGTPYRSWNGVQAMWGTYQGYIYIGFGDPAIDPDNHEITYTPSSNNGGAVITLTGRQYITIQGLTIRNGYNGIYVRSNSSDCIIQDDSIIGGKYCVNIASGSSRIMVRRNKLTLGYVHPLDPDNPRHWFIWAAFKLTSDYDRICVSLNDVGSDNEVSENYMFENFDGVENQGSSLRLTVRDNIIERLADDGLEPDGEETEARWHGNIVKQCNIAYRHKNITGNGPMYIYRNKFYSKSGTENSGNSGIYFFGGSTTTAYFYHNTIVTSRGFSFGSTNVSVGLPNLWVINNLFSCEKIYSENSGWSKKPHFDYNYIGGDLSTPASWWGNNNKVIKDGRLWSQDSVPDFLLSANSLAREVGIDISKQWNVQGITSPPLVGYPPEYFLGIRPDAGAQLYGKILDGIVDRESLGTSVITSPNPFTDKLTLQIKTTGTGSLSILLFNLHGNLICQRQVNKDFSGLTVLNFEGQNLKSGIYLLSVIQEGKMIGNQKLIRL